MSRKLERELMGRERNDEMRSKAEKLMKLDLAEGEKAGKIRRSASAPSNLNMRYYKKGGHVSHGLNKEQTELYIPKRSNTKKAHVEKFEKTEGYRRGGKIAKKAEGGGMEMVAPQQAMVAPQQAPVGAPSLENTDFKRKGGYMRKHKAEGGETKHKRGGKIAKEESKYHKKHGKDKYGIGGNIAGKLVSPLLNKIPVIGGVLGDVANTFGSFLPFSEGGEAKRKGGKVKAKHHYAGGGSVWEGMMEGQHSTDRAHQNYEAQMVGMRPVRKRECHGGEMHQHYAMGGVGKVRKGVVRHRPKFND